MTPTTVFGLRRPVIGDLPDVPRDIGYLADDVEDRLLDLGLRTWFKDGDPTGVVDSSAALQALLTDLYNSRAARGVQGDTIVLPNGTFKWDTEVKYYVKSGYAQSIVGQGPSTKIKVTADLGRNKYALRPTDSRSSIQKSLLANFNIRGNNAFVAWNMHGVALASGCTMSRVYCEGGFRGGLVALNDHTTFIDCESHGCRFNLYFGYQYQAKDNHIIRGGNYTDGILACIGIAGNNGLGGSLLTGFHVGNAPYCFYKEDAADSANFDTFDAEPINVGLNSFYSSNEALGVRFENSQMGIFYAVNAAAGSQIEDNLFLGCDQSGQGYSGTFQSAFVCDYFLRNTFIRSESLLVSDTGHKYVEATGQVYANIVRTDGPMPAWIIAPDLDNGDRSGWRFESGIGEVFVAKKCDANVNAGDVLTGWVGGYGGSVKPFDSTFASAVLGVARNTHVSGDYAMVQLRGYCSKINVIDAATPDSAHYLIPTVTNGKATHVPTGVAASARPFARATSGAFGSAGSMWCQGDLFVA